jgi:cellulose synthase/poly-beta-1,6-N-acetylglucosamine synthase-like glycosyltransferase
LTENCFNIIKENILANKRGKEEAFLQDLVSVIIPVYNCEKYLEDAIKSVINQTYENI